MDQRTTLQAREDRRVDLLSKCLVVRQDDATTPSAQRLVRRRGDNMRMRHRVRVHAGGNKARDMGHIHHQVGVDGIGDFAELGKIEGTRIGRATSQNDLWLAGLRLVEKRIEINLRGLFINAVLLGIEPFTGQVRRGAVRQVTTCGKRHAEDRIARLQQRQEHGLVRLCAGMWLHIDESSAKQLFRTLDGKCLNNIDMLAAAIIAAAGIAFGIFIGQNRALRFENTGADDILGRDHLDLVLLADQFMPDRSCQFRIGIRQRGREESVHYVLFSDVVHSLILLVRQHCAA